MSFNVADVIAAVAEANADRPAIIHHGVRTVTYAELAEGTRRFGSALAAHGLGAHAERDALSGHESGQDHIALYLHNGVEYLESMIGAYVGRVAPLNVNYRYVADELRYLLADSKARAIVFHDTFAPTLAEVLPDLPDLTLLIQVPDATGADLLPGAVRYADFIASGDPAGPAVDRSPDDLYILYTGGTTGMPKGVLWRQHDIFVSALGGRPFGAPEPYASIEALVEVSRNGGARMMSAAPLMHGAAQWAAFNAMTGGHTVVFQTNTTRVDPADVWETVVSEQVISLQLVGDAMARPLLAELENGTYDLSGLFALVSGGAALNPSLKERIMELVPNVAVLDAVGSSETGIQMSHMSTKGAASTGTFTPGVDTAVVNVDLTRELTPGDEETGWLAQRGHVPLGYLGDEKKTAATYPVINGVRFSVPGDRAIWRADGIIELLGRDSVTINSGGEKIYAEEVEQAIAQHPAVYDVIVVGRDSEKWGSEVVAVVQLAEGATADDEELLAEAASRLARYKLPKAFVYRDQLMRSPAGKADYRWARAQAEEA